MFASIKNGQLARKAYILQTRKKICESFLNILWNEGFILGYKINDSNKLKIYLKYKNNEPSIHQIKSISKPGQRIYYSAKQVWKMNSTKTLLVFSTNLGLQSLLNCKKKKIGGEPIAFIN